MCTFQGYTNAVGPAGHFELVPDQNGTLLRELMGRYYLNFPLTLSNRTSFTLPLVDNKHG